jgi:hypothetical protein
LMHIFRLQHTASIICYLLTKQHSYQGHFYLKLKQMLKSSLGSEEHLLNQIVNP